MTPQDLVAPVAQDILAMAGQVEADRKLPQPLMDRLTTAGLFSIYTPAQFGGLELGFPAALQVVEEVSKLDGSTGWTVALGFANDIFTSALADEVASRIFKNGSALIAGAPGFTVRACPADAGYRLSGQWSFCSGAPNADWIGVAAPIVENGAPRMGPAGPEMVFCFLRPADVEIVDTWHVTGLRGTGSHDVRVEDVFVPAAMTGSFVFPMGPRTMRESKMARIPFITALGMAQSPSVCLGIARHAIEEFRSLALAKESPFGGGKLADSVQAQAGLARSEALLRSARSFWYESVEGIWKQVSRGQPVSPEDRTGVRLAALTAAENSVEAVDRLFRLAGSTSIFQSSLLERCWRDVHTAAQHMQVQDARWETAGRVLLGLEPANPFV
jgi:alkylation response protein AidB-like acyl-CoA dehydrogenase